MSGMRRTGANNLHAVEIDDALTLAERTETWRDRHFVPARCRKLWRVAREKLSSGGLVRACPAFELHLVWRELLSFAHVRLH